MIGQFKHPGFAGWVGVARADITPPSGIYARNWGAAKHDASEGIHRPLFLTALAVRESEEGDPLVLVEADLGWWRNLGLERDFRGSILEAIGLDESRLMFSLAHTHAAPPLTDQADPDWEGGDLLEPYLNSVEGKAIETISRAMRNPVRGVLEWHTGKCGLATERDLVDPDDESRWLCGFDPDGIPDETLLVGRITDDSGNVLAVIANYACHPTTLAWDNHLISPDFVGAMRELIEREIEGATAFFLQGASGELAPRYQYVGDTRVADAHGRQLGFAVLSTLAGMEPPGTRLRFRGAEESGAPLAVWEREASRRPGGLRARRLEVELPLKDWPSATGLERRLEAAKGDRVTEERIRRQLDIRRGLGDGETWPLPVWIWNVGDAWLIGNLAEAYSWIQRGLRGAFPDQAVVYMNLVNGSIGYLPPADYYDDDIYQVWQTPFASGSLEILDEAIRMAITDWG